VRNFLGAAGEQTDGAVLSGQTRTVSIGPVTSEALREHGLKVDVEASEHDIGGLVAALLADVASR
jgi:uroporphyrinogen III methyltransferase/synthase